jgi:hypothetical protein
MISEAISTKNPAIQAGNVFRKLVRRTGIEPVTLGLKGPCSAN